MSEDEERGFKVADRRRFDAEGGLRADPDAQDDAAAADAPVADELDAPRVEPGEDLPAIDFSTFVLSLSTSAMVHLGEAPHPDGSTRADLALARQTIDILAMLRDKTAGNLSEEEQRLIDELLYDLRLRFVAARR